MSTIDNLTDQLQSKVFRNLVDLPDVRNCRLVSQKWKRVVMNACQNKFHVVFPLTDSTLYAAQQLKDTIVSFDIYAFSGKGNKETWAKSGIDLLLQTTEWLQFSGCEISSSEIRKITGLAIDSLKMLSFKCFKKDLTCPFLEMKQTFSALRELSIGYYSSENDNDTFDTFTKTLERWATLDCGVQLPVLKCLNLYFDSRSKKWDFYNSVTVTSEDLFRNYLAIAKVLLMYKQTLKQVQIERVFGRLHVQHFLPSMFQPRWTEMERGLEGLHELNLDQLKLTTKTYVSDYSLNDCSSDIDVVGRLQNLNNVLYQSLIFPRDHWPLLIGTLSGFNNLDGSYLTSLKINLRHLPAFPDPSLVINLGALKDCMKLKTLWLTVNFINPWPLLIRNVELLPKGISILRFAHTTAFRTYTCNEILPSQLQIRWIIDNLRELESFWLSLMIPQQTNENNNNEQIEAADAEGNDNDDNVGQDQQQEDVNSLANINLDTFRDLLTMPKLKDLRVEMRKVQDIAIHPFGDHTGMGTTLEALREYTDLCDASEYTTTTTTSPNFGANNINGFATLTIQRNQN